MWTEGSGRRCVCRGRWVTTWAEGTSLKTLLVNTRPVVAQTPRAEKAQLPSCQVASVLGRASVQEDSPCCFRGLSPSCGSWELVCCTRDRKLPVTDPESKPENVCVDVCLACVQTCPEPAHLCRGSKSLSWWEGDKRERGLGRTSHTYFFGTLPSLISAVSLQDTNKTHERNGRLDGISSDDC